MSKNNSNSALANKTSSNSASGSTSGAFSSVKVTSLTPLSVVASDANDNLTSISNGTAGYVLTSTGTSTAPTWQPGGTASAANLAGGSAGVVPYQSASGTTSFSAAGSSGQLLTSGGTGQPTWKSTTGSGNAVLATSPTITSASLVTPSLGVATGTQLVITGATGTDSEYNTIVARTATNSGGCGFTLRNESAGTPGSYYLGLSNSVFQQNAFLLQGAMDIFLAPGNASAANSIRIKAGSSSPAQLYLPGLSASSYVVTDSSGNLTSSAAPSSVPNVAGGTAGSVPYQIAPSQTGFSAAGSSGQVLTSGGTGAPTWNATIGSGAIVRSNGPTVTNAVLVTPSLGTATGTGLTVTSTSYTPVTIATTDASGGTGITLENTGSTGSYYIALSNSTFEQNALLFQGAMDIFLAPGTATAANSIRIKKSVAGGACQLNLPGITANSYIGTDGSGNVVAKAAPTAVGSISGGSAGQILYQTATSSTSFLPNGSSGQLLQSQGAGNAPIWTSQFLSGTIPQVTVLTTPGSGSYYAPADCKYYRIQMVGGGGGGEYGIGGVGFIGSGGGGGAGAYAELFVTNANSASSGTTNVAPFFDYFIGSGGLNGQNTPAGTSHAGSGGETAAYFTYPTSPYTYGNVRVFGGLPASNFSGGLPGPADPSYPNWPTILPNYSKTNINVERITNGGGGCGGTQISNTPIGAIVSGGTGGSSFFGGGGSGGVSNYGGTYGGGCTSPVFGAGGGGGAGATSSNTCFGGLGGQGAIIVTAYF